jgi:hypothetical protein
MKLKNTSTNEIYYVTLLFRDIIPVEALILMWSNEKNDSAITISYETLAVNIIDLISTGMGIDHEVLPVSIPDLPLYVHFPNKSLNFDRLLKGEPLIKSPSTEIICQLKK